MFNFLPREEKFYKMLASLEAHSTASARHLKTLILERHTSEKAHQADEAIKKAKFAAKKEMETLTQEICRTLITPFDREDLQEFGATLYHIPKQIEKIKDRILTHDLYPFNEDFNRFADIIEREAQAMSELVAELNGKFNSRTINDKAAIIHELEDQGDVVLGQLIAHVFHDIADTREVILRKDIYEMLEDVTDMYRDAANIALRIVLKHT